MNILKAKYQGPLMSEDDGKNTGIILTVEGWPKDWCVPLDPMNRHYIEVMEKVNAGTLTIEDADE